MYTTYEERAYQRKKAKKFGEALAIYEHVKIEVKELLTEGVITEARMKEILEDWSEQLDL